MPNPAPDSRGVRLQKVLAQAGLGSRRACEQLIEQGRVVVNGEQVTQQGQRVDPSTAVVTVDGKRISIDATKLYFVLNKPRGVITTMSDPQGRLSVGDLVQELPTPGTARAFPVGRLDGDTEGLLLITNDGDFAHHVMHPSAQVSKVYRAVVQGQLTPAVGQRLLRGVELDDGPARADKFRLLSTSGERTLVEITIHEGRHRIVRRMFDAVDHPVQRLVRTRVAGVSLGSLKPGRWRELTMPEMASFYPTAT